MMIMVMMTALMMLIRDEAVKNPNPISFSEVAPGEVQIQKIIAKTANLDWICFPRWESNSKKHRVSKKYDSCRFAFFTLVFHVILLFSLLYFTSFLFHFSIFSSLSRLTFLFLFIALSLSFHSSLTSVFIALSLSFQLSFLSPRSLLSLLVWNGTGTLRNNHNDHDK